MSEADKMVDPSKKKRRRRNYDDYDNEVAQEEKDLKQQKKNQTSIESKVGDVSSKTGSIAQKKNADDDSDSDVDDEKLDRLMGNELEEEEDDLTEIDTTNIITSGRRTRGKIIDYKKAARELDNAEQKQEPSTVTKDQEDKDDDEEDDEEFKV
ncbi:similar to Saccharomyces cerevisiae YER030W CHZ1 Histone chaperone for Htz1p/H2A-H2B dimer [Maudiozyma saulgeensis]|uniref:Histone H2A.Z-specific chaperone CHZ1 n=1 Tax=Maudiozyma saulgeensis TaxID=1789683 RepID=A0A1X7R4L8_9SACH|nr:similar to Saccharomyces cerevisiae YER030W CHZ1 Histone chaperone for Htz1p/H2A-H2B dimer [Kazachstania saulgeensis]